MPKTDGVPLAEAQTSRGKIYGLLKNEIFECRIAPSEILVVDELAKRFGVSRTPVREALLALANEGLLDAKHHVGFIVAPVNAKEIVETYSLRIVLEKESARLATRNAGSHDLERLLAIADKSDPSGGRRFHSLIAEISGWGVLAQMLETLMDKTARSRTLFVTSHTPQGASFAEKYDHRMIYGAIASHDEEEASSLMEMHLREARKYILGAISAI